jgi:hypothetical protein
MDWQNERYVRLFVRDTTTWKLIPWQSRLLLPAILRKLDRSGVIDLGNDGEEGLAALVDVPADFVKVALPPLLKRGVFRLSPEGMLVMPNFLAAQEARQSDAQRKRESRENQRILAMQSQTVTGCHTLSESPPVTDCPGPSPIVTPDQTRLDQTNPDQENLTRDPSATKYKAPSTSMDPTTVHGLLFRLKVAVEKAQPQNGMWTAGPWGQSAADKFLAGFISDPPGDEIIRRIDLFAADKSMAPWSTEKFTAKYLEIGQPKAAPILTKKAPRIYE